MHISKYAASVTTTTGKAGTGYTDNISGGYVVAVLYDGTISSTANLTVAGEDSTMPILTSTVGSSGVRYIREDTVINSTGGSASTFVKTPIAGERIKVSVAASSAAAQTGTFTFYVEGA